VKYAFCWILANSVCLNVLCVVAFVHIYQRNFSSTFDVASVSSRCVHSKLSQSVHDWLNDFSCILEKIFFLNYLFALFHGWILWVTTIYMLVLTGFHRAFGCSTNDSSEFFLAFIWWVGRHWMDVTYCPSSVLLKTYLVPCVCTSSPVIGWVWVQSKLDVCCKFLQCWTIN